MEQISISEIQRNLHKLDDFDIIEVIDKKRDKIKGYFIESKYASLVEELSQKVQSKKKEHKKSLRGALSAYADPSKMKEEKGAWERHVIEKYKNR
ncbi:MAG: hypothetical protein DRQ78_05125 [Epsilonproteobacteria bacterium]|nr:MAG: hypothetical protein DRQ78_05125 [Campylobacterota bacterium]